MQGECGTKREWNQRNINGQQNRVFCASGQPINQF
jgi:hypothetical protein